MAHFKCSFCGGNLQVSPGQTVGLCEYCGTQQTVSTAGSLPANATVDSLLQRAFLFLEDSQWRSADAYCEKVLDIDPENASAYLGKLLASVHAKNKKALDACPEPFFNNPHYQKILRFGDEALKAELHGYSEGIRIRKETARQEHIYRNACALMAQKQFPSYQQAAAQFQSIAGYRDSAQQQQLCLELAESARKDLLYQDAKASMRGTDPGLYLAAIQKFEAISAWRDARQQIELCREKIQELEQEKLAGKERRAQAARQRTKRLILIGSAAVLLVLAVVIAVNLVRYFKYQPLQEAFASGQITSDFVTANYGNPQYDKGVLKVFAKELEACHRADDLKRALDLISILAESGVVFHYADYGDDDQETVYYDPHIYAWYSFTVWLRDAAIRQGEKIPTVYSDDFVDETYQVYGYRLSFSVYSNGNVSRALLYIPDLGWYEVNASESSLSNKRFHSKQGGVMVG